MFILDVTTITKGSSGSSPAATAGGSKDSPKSIRLDMDWQWEKLRKSLGEDSDEYKDIKSAHDSNELTGPILISILGKKDHIIPSILNRSDFRGTEDAPLDRIFGKSSVEKPAGARDTFSAANVAHGTQLTKPAITRLAGKPLAEVTTRTGTKLGMTAAGKATGWFFSRGVPIISLLYTLGDIATDFWDASQQEDQAEKDKALDRAWTNVGWTATGVAATAIGLGIAAIFVPVAAPLIIGALITGAAVGNVVGNLRKDSEPMFGGGFWKSAGNFFST